MDQHCQRLEEIGSIRRKLHNDRVKMTEDKMKTTLQSKKIKRRRDDDFGQSSSSANALRFASSNMKHMKAAAAEQQLRTSRWVDAQGSRTVRRVLYKDEDIDYEFLVPKKEHLDENQVRLMSCGILSLLLRVLVFFLVSLVSLSPSWLLWLL